MDSEKKKKASQRYFVSAADQDQGGDVQVFTPNLTTASSQSTQEQSIRKSKKNKMSSDPNKLDSQKGAIKKSPKKKQTQDSAAQEAETHDLSNLDVIKFAYRQDKYGGPRGRTANKRKKESKDPFPGDKPIPSDKLKKYKRGEQAKGGLQTGFHNSKYRQQAQKYSNAVKQAARTELLLHEEPGYLEADEGEATSDITQHEIAKAADITSAQKFFELKLDKFGPYRVNYTRNGRFLLMGGGKGHVAAFDWQTKKLMCEMNVMETVNDVKWLHQETMYAVAQKQWTYIYDNQGVELHCLKHLDSVLRMEFLPYHFLLATANAKSYVSWLDISIGQKVAGFGTGLGRLDVMSHNPANAILHLGHSGGTVTLWSPNVKEPLAKLLCHGVGTRSIAVDHTGKYMATSGIDRTLKIWDLRTYKAMYSYKIGAGAGSLAFSQKGMLSVGMGNVLEVYRDCLSQPVTAPYLSHRLPSTVANLQFCPYEDVLGVGHGTGLSSLIVPGCGEANFDALESNPYQTKAQRQQAEVKMLLEKIQPDMINLDTSALGKVDKKTLEEKMEEKKNLLYLKPQRIEFEPRYKKKGGSKSGKIEKRKQGVQFEHKQKQIREFQHRQEKEAKTQKAADRDAPYSVFDRFKKKAV